MCCVEGALPSLHSANQRQLACSEFPCPRVCALCTVQCPVCKKSVDLVHGEDPNDTWVRHAATECDPAGRPSSKKARCGAPGCKEKLTLTNKTTCTKCRVDVCLR